MIFSDERIAGKLPILFWMAGVASWAIAVAVVGKLLRPKVLHDRVLHVINHLFLYSLSVAMRLTPSSVASGYSNRARSVFVRMYSMPPAPGVLPNLLEGRHGAAYHEWRFVVADVLHHVKRDWVLEIKRSRSRRHLLRDSQGCNRNSINRPPCGSIKVSPRRSNILNRHVLKQGRLAHAGLADDVHMAVAVLRLDAERGRASRPQSVAAK